MHVFILVSEMGADLHISEESQLVKVELSLMSVIECCGCSAHSRISRMLYTNRWDLR